MAGICRADTRPPPNPLPRGEGARYSPSPRGRGLGEGAPPPRQSLPSLRAWLAAIAVVALAAGAAACGKRGDLDPPPGEQADFPRQYPR